MLARISVISFESFSILTNMFSLLRSIIINFIAGRKPIIYQVYLMLVFLLIIGTEIAYANIVWLQVIVYKAETMESF